jgi:hypothetical protein
MFTPSNYHDGWVYQRGAFEQWFDETWTSILARDTADRYLTQSRKDACRGPRLPRNGCVKPSFSNHTKSEKYISAIRATSLRTAGCSGFHWDRNCEYDRAYFTILLPVFIWGKRFPQNTQYGPSESESPNRSTTEGRRPLGAAFVPTVPVYAINRSHRQRLTERSSG